MEPHLLLRNRSLQRVVVGVPEGGRGVQARLVTAAGDVVAIPESALLALVRGWTAVTTHPSRRAVELIASEVADPKEGFARYQLVEHAADEGGLRRELGGQPPQDARILPATSARDRIQTFTDVRAPPGPVWNGEGSVDPGPPSTIVPLTTERVVVVGSDNPVRPPPLHPGSPAPPNLEEIRGRHLFEETSGHDPTGPHRAPTVVPLQVPHGSSSDSADDLVLDDSLETDDGPVFGEVPTFGGRTARPPRGR